MKIEKPSVSRYNREDFWRMTIPAYKKLINDIDEVNKM